MDRSLVLDAVEVPPGYGTVNPFVVVRGGGGAVAFISFLTEVFEGRETLAAHSIDADGLLIHAEVRIGSATVMLCDAKPQWVAPPTLLQVYVHAADEVLARAVARGSEVVTTATPFHGGQRLARFRDPWGGLWWLFEHGPGSTAPSQAPQELPSWRPDPGVPPSYVLRTLDKAMKGLGVDVVAVEEPGDALAVDDVVIDERGRPEPPLAAGEAATLLGFLDFQRATLEWRTRGLDEGQLAATLPPSSITLGGLLTHLAYVEDYWFSEVVAERESLEPWASVDWAADRDWDWAHAERLGSAEARDFWKNSVERSRAVVAAELARDEADGLARTHPAWQGQGRVSLRWVLVHMVEEYARHNGHADLLRESIDGEVGE